MFMNVADYVAKLTKGLDNRDSNLSMRKKQMDLKEIWQQMFVKMHVISNEPRSEIRKALIQILENVIVNHGNIFPESVWPIIFR